MGQHRKTLNTKCAVMRLNCTYAIDLTGLHYFKVLNWWINTQNSIALYDWRHNVRVYNKKYFYHYLKNFTNSKYWTFYETSIKWRGLKKPSFCCTIKKFQIYTLQFLHCGKIQPMSLSPFLYNSLIILERDITYYSASLHILTLQNWQSLHLWSLST